MVVKIFLLLSILLLISSAFGAKKTTKNSVNDLMPDENEDEEPSINVDGLGGNGLVDDIVVGGHVNEKIKAKVAAKTSNCSKDLLLSLDHSEPLKDTTEVTWSTVVNSYHYDPVKNQLTLVADCILNWKFENVKSDACNSVQSVLVEPASLIWTPRFVFLNNLDSSTNILPSDMWEKWPAVVHIDRQLITWHFAAK